MYISFIIFELNDNLCVLCVNYVEVNIIIFIGSFYSKLSYMYIVYFYIIVQKIMYMVLNDIG